jgi:hypothetical protein
MYTSFAGCAAICTFKGVPQAACGRLGCCQVHVRQPSQHVCLHIQLPLIIMCADCVCAHWDVSVCSSAWNNLAEITKPYLTPARRLHDLTPNPFGADAASMATAYNRVLACYQEYGPTDPRSEAAVLAAFERDPCRWVPLLLAGGALGVPGRPPLVALGSKEEAAVSHHAACLLTDMA